MEYRYYVHDTKENVGVTEYGTNIRSLFIENLCDCINWFMWESDSTCLYTITFFIGEEKNEISFGFTDEDEMYAKINKTIVDRWNVTDHIKSHF